MVVVTLTTEEPLDVRSMEQSVDDGLGKVVEDGDIGGHRVYPSVIVEHPQTGKREVHVTEIIKIAR